MWTLYERPKREYRKNLYAAININRGGMFLNRLACEMVGMQKPEDTRFFMFFYDKENKDKFGFRSLLNRQDNIKEHGKNIYKVKYRDENKTAKINALGFIRRHKLVERSIKLGQSTFPLIKEGEDFYYFELK